MGHRTCTDGPAVLMAFFRTKPRDEQLSFLTSCWRCRGELSISNGRVDRHDCQRLQPMGEWQDALADYYDSGMIGEPPKRQRLEDIRFT